MHQRSLREMNARQSDDSRRPASSPLVETQPEHALGWLSGWGTRLGLPGAQPLRASLESMLKNAGEGEALSAEEREMLLRTLRFGVLKVEDVMVPRADIIAVDESEPIRELLRTFDA